MKNLRVHTLIQHHQQENPDANRHQSHRQPSYYGAAKRGDCFRPAFHAFSIAVFLFRSFSPHLLRLEADVGKLRRAGVGGNFIPFVGFLLVLIDHLWPLWDAQNQALHDKVIRSHVVYTGGS